ncbi:hypothetical protein HDU93_007349 [Gonapodya sp. JEL0774]|nr:hypothetical protein HDU93_007349 [Gonapodya sp. JEL0774]
MASVLQLFWDLVSIDPAVRNKAVLSLLSTLTEEQTAYVNQLRESGQWNTLLEQLRALHTRMDSKSALSKRGKHVDGGKSTDRERKDLEDTTEKELEELLDQMCASNVSYALKRLLRGLPSSREAARQGFAVALTELLSLLSFIPITHVLDSLTKHTDVTGSMNGQEEREMYFGRVFGVMSLVSSGRLAHVKGPPPTSNDEALVPCLAREGEFGQTKEKKKKKKKGPVDEDLPTELAARQSADSGTPSNDSDVAQATPNEVLRIATSVIEWSEKKVYLRESCYKVLVDLCTELSNTPNGKSLLESVARAIFASTYPSSDDSPAATKSPYDSPEDLWFACHLEDLDVSIPHIPSPVLSRTALSKIVEALKASSHTHPKLHSVWEVVLRKSIEGDVKGGKGVGFKEFWKAAVQDRLLASSSHVHKYLALQCVVLVLPLLATRSPEQIAFIISPILIRTLVNNLSDKKTLLNKICGVVCNKLTEIVTGQKPEPVAKGRKDKAQAELPEGAEPVPVPVPLPNSNLGLSVLVTILNIGEQGMQFDRITGTKTLESILQGLDTKGITGYIKYLCESFVDLSKGGPGQIGTAAGEGAEAQGGVRSARSIESHRQWCVDQLFHLVKMRHRLGKVTPVDEREMVEGVMRFVFLNGFVKTTDETGKLKSKLGKEALVLVEEALTYSKCLPALTEATRAICRARFWAILGDAFSGSSELLSRHYRDAIGRRFLPRLIAAARVKTASGDFNGLTEPVPPRETFTTANERLLQYPTFAVTIAKQTEKLSPHLVFARPLPDALVAARNKAWGTANLISKRCDTELAGAEISKETRELIGQLKSIELMFIFLGLQCYSASTMIDESSENGQERANDGEGLLIGEEQLLDDIKELQDCYQRIDVGLFPKEKKALKRKASSVIHELAGEDSSDPSPVDVLVDLLVSFLSKPSALLRQIVEIVFRSVSVMKGGLTKKATTVLLNIAENREDTEMEDVEDGEEAVSNDDTDKNSERSGENASSDDELDEVESSHDSEEDEDDDDDDDKAEEDDEERKPSPENELRNAIEKALRESGAGVSMDSDAESEDEEDWDDDQMEAFDAKLAEVFRERKNAKREKKDTHPRGIDFPVPLLRLAYSTATSEKEIHSKVTAIIKSRFGRAKEYPKVRPGLTDFTAQDLEAQLVEVMSLAKKSGGGREFGDCCAGTAVFIVKTWIGNFRDLDSQRIVHQDPEPKHKDKKLKFTSGSTEQAQYPLESSSEAIARIYGSVLSDYMMSKHGRFPLPVLEELIKRFPDIAWRAFASKLVVFMDYQSCSRDFDEDTKMRIISNARQFQITQAFALMEHLMKAQKDPATITAPTLSTLVSEIASAFQSTFRFLLAADKSKGLEAVFRQPRLRQVLGHLAGVVRRTRQTLGDKFHILWQVDEISGVLHEYWTEVQVVPLAKKQHEQKAKTGKAKPKDLPEKTQQWRAMKNSINAFYGALGLKPLQ